MKRNVEIRHFGKGLRFAASLTLFWLMLFYVHAAEGEYLSASEFLNAALDGDVPEASLVWLTGERGNTAAEILGHKPASLRLRYWYSGERTVWILEETGREKPITAGFVIENGKLANTRVLAFRESRGWEIRHEFFTKQFQDVSLTPEHSLSASIDNITGATLSVSAMKRMARLALYLDSEVRNAAP